MLDNQWVFIYYFNVDAINVHIVAWLSLVERCVRDAEVASSNLVASTYKSKACWSSGQDDALSRRKPGFDSRTGHLLLRKQQHFLKVLPWLSW